jgi:hypothetical protein
MKNLKLTFIIILFSIAKLYSQDWSSGIYNVGVTYPGYIIKNDGTKIEGYLEAQERGAIDGVGFSNQNRVIFYSDPKNRKTKITYKPEDIKEYMIADKIYKTMNYSGGLMGKPLRFLLVKKEGRIGTYVWYEHKGFENMMRQNPTFEDKLIIQKGDEKPIEQTSLYLGFVKKVGELVSDDAELANKVAKKEKGYGMSNFDKVLEEYNTWYAENHKQ